MDLDTPDANASFNHAVDAWTERSSVGTLLVLIGLVVCIFASLGLPSAWALATGVLLSLGGLSLVHRSERHLRAIRNFASSKVDSKPITRTVGVIGIELEDRVAASKPS